MFLSTLPDLTPRDVSPFSPITFYSPPPQKARPLIPKLPPQPHNLWYTARHAPTTVPHHLLATHDPSQPHDAAHNHHPHPRDRDARRALLERTPLARLRHDEAVMDRRRANVANYGTQWLKPPGVAKTLYQLREERREAEEHAEAMRREHTLAAQLAEAAAEEGGALAGLVAEEVDEESAVDLDAMVPEAEGFGFDGEDSGEEEDTATESEAEEETENNAGAVAVSPAEEVQVREVRAAEDRLMDLMAREDGTLDVDEAFGQEAEAREEMLEEDDLVNMQSTPPAGGNADSSMGMDMDMDADLDAVIPSGEGNEYEHTDSDEDIDESTREISFAGRSSTMTRPRQLRRSVHRSSLRSRASLAQSDVADISELLSGEGSSFLEASPYPRRRA